MREGGIIPIPTTVADFAYLGSDEFIVRPQAIGRSATVLQGPQLSTLNLTRKRAWPMPLGRLNRNSLRLNLRQFRNCDFQHTVGGFRLDVLGVHRIRKAEAT